LILYVDSSALVKRYVHERGSEAVQTAMQEADACFVCRIAFVETVRAVTLAAGAAAARPVRDEWNALGVVEVDQPLVEHATELALAHNLRSLDAIHLASALCLPADELAVASWDDRLSAAAAAEGLTLLPR
jgi:uncharacterized protein